jgi:2-keto-3-deoxy-6-phosphogluconate aldolase
MAAVTDVTIASGIPTVGTGTVATLSKFEKAASSGASCRI